MSHQVGPVEASILADLGPSFRARRIDVRGGSLRVVEGGEGPTIVLIHGRGGSLASWAPIMPELARSRRVLAVDLPGFGASTAPRFTGGDPESATAFFVDPIESWMESEGLSSSVVVGHSLGGLVAVELCLRGRIGPRALVLIASMGLGPEASLASRIFFRLWPERVARALGRDRFGRLIGAEGPRAAALSYELSAVERPDASRAFDALMPIFGPVPNRRARLGSIAVPALVIAGDRDDVFPVPSAIAAAAALGRGELAVERAGHAPHVEAPARVLARVDSFLAGVA